jgi:N-acetylglucosamine-6-phosphate deacetylase
LLTLAPELPGSAEFIRHVTGSGARVAIGHSGASDAEIGAAIAAGMTLCTHLGNGVPMELPRHDNIIQRLLARDELTAVFIADGLHVPPAVLRNFVRAKPPGKILFTTDCMAAAGAGPGRFRIGRLEIEVGADGVVREPGKPNFAGSSLTMDRCAENVERWLGWTREEAEAACGARVRAALGLAG